MMFKSEQIDLEVPNLLENLIKNFRIMEVKVKGKLEVWNDRAA